MMGKRIGSALKKVVHNYFEVKAHFCGNVENFSFAAILQGENNNLGILVDIIEFVIMNLILLSLIYSDDLLKNDSRYKMIEQPK